MSNSWTHFTLDRRSATYWRVTFDALRAEQYGYVNRAIADEALDDEVEAMALRLAGFDR